MALRNLSEGVMYLLLDDWLRRHRERLDAHDETRWLVERFTLLRDRIMLLRRDPKMKLAAAREAARAQDVLYDDDLRACFYGLLALEYRARDPEQKVAFRRARLRIFDRGLAMVNMSYADEAAETDLVLSRIDNSIRVLLHENMLGDTTLNELFDRWCDEARRLGDLDTERTVIEAESKEASGPAYLALRKAWMELVRVFRSTVALLPEAEQRPLLRRLEEAEARADARAAARRARGGADAEPVDPDGVLPEDGSEGRGEADLDLFDGDDIPTVDDGTPLVAGGVATLTPSAPLAPGGAG